MSPRNEYLLKQSYLMLDALPKVLQDDYGI